MTSPIVDTKLLAAVIHKEQVYVGEFRSLLDGSAGDSLKALAAYAAAAPVPTFRTSIAVIGNLSIADAALRQYTGSIDNRHEQLRGMMDIADEVGEVVHENKPYWDPGLSPALRSEILSAQNTQDDVHKAIMHEMHEGLTERCRAMVECGKTWVEMGQSALRVLEAANLDADADALNLFSRDALSAFPDPGIVRSMSPALSSPGETAVVIPKKLALQSSLLSNDQWSPSWPIVVPRELLVSDDPTRRRDVTRAAEEITTRSEPRTKVERSSVSAPSVHPSTSTVVGGRKGFEDRTAKSIHPTSAPRYYPVVTPKVYHDLETQIGPDIVHGAVTALIDGLHNTEQFDELSDQIIAWADTSEKEADGRTLILVIRLIFAKAVDDEPHSETYARLCRKMMESISPKVQDNGIINQEGKPFAGGRLFLKYLLSLCQQEFERAWAVKETDETESPSAGSSADGKAGQRRAIGVVRFIGELFKLQMVTQRIVHECIKKLLGYAENPKEEEIQCLCKLLSTAGLPLDTPKSRVHMDVYFLRMKEIAKSGIVSSHMRDMLRDTVELRDREWVVPRSKVAASRKK